MFFKGTYVQLVDKQVLETYTQYSDYKQQNCIITESLGNAFISSQLLFSPPPWFFGGWTIPSILLSETVVFHSVSEGNEELRQLIT